MMYFTSVCLLLASIPFIDSVWALPPDQNVKDARSLQSNSYLNVLAATGLLGSHFGVPGLPGDYDFVIVGGGTAGLTLATRLAENSSYSVAVIEAGGFYETDNGNLTQIPADAVYFLEANPVVRNPLIDWYQFTTPQAGFGGRAVHYTTGRTLGGSSARNFLWYQRSATGAYQQWADMVGDAAYTFANLDQYFKRSVQFTPPNEKARPANASAPFDSTSFSSTGGPLQVSYPSWVNAFSSFFGAALKTLGLPELPGFTDGNLLGWAYIAFTLVPTQVRSTSEESYLRQALLKTDNLNVYKSTVAKKILFNGTTATGVEVDTGGFTYEIKANKEVIVSAGAFRSPQLLMVSGIGPQATLEANGITCISNLAGVGQNLWDHILFGPAAAVDVLTHSQLAVNPSFAVESVNSYNQNRTGILTNVGADLLAFEKLPNGTLSDSTRSALDKTFTPDWPDIELVAFDNNLVSLSPDGRNYANSIAILVAPFSRGNVTINSTDTAVNPIVNPNWLSDPRDQEVAIAGFKRARQIFATSPLSGIVQGPELFPGNNVTSNTAILAAIMETASTVSHAAGTCAMGKVGELNAVIDSKARVMGIKGLRVVDASSLPILPPGHPQGTVYALAEKISDDILNGS